MRMEARDKSRLSFGGSVLSPFLSFSLSELAMSRIERKHHDVYLPRSVYIIRIRIYKAGYKV